MSLANLSIDVTVNTGQAQRGLRDVGATAQEQFMRSGAAVDDFRTQLLTASTALDRAARGMGAGMDRAANEIEASAQRSEVAIQQIGEAANDVKFDSLGERLSAAFGAAFGSGYAATQAYIEKTEQFVVAKGKAIAIGLAITAVSAVAGAVYAAYKVVSASINFITGLFTGDSYKSSNIDRLIERNQQQLDAQSEAKKKAMELDVQLTRSMREDGDELDRLGVRYKDANGKLLDHRSYLLNVKAALEQYAEGYDQLKAVEAIGAGSLAEVTAALAGQSQEAIKAKARNDEYLLAIGPQGQAEIARYQRAIKEFNEEMQRTSDGFSHAIADSIMPALTDLAEFFRDGWPFVVRAFRGSIATITSLFYGLQMAAEIGLEVVRGAVQSLAELVIGAGSATIKAFKGDFAGAADDLRRAWDLAGTAVSQAMDQIAKDAEKNRNRMALAFGLDGFNAQDPAGYQPKGGKQFVPKPKDQQQAPVKSPYQNYLDELDRMATKLEQNEYASLRLKAAQLAQKEGIDDLAEAYARIDRIQRGDSQKVVEQHSQALYEAANAYEFETSLIGKNLVEQEKLIAAYRERQAADEAIRAAQRAGRPLDQLAIDDINAIAAAYTKQAQAQIDARDKLQRSFDVGVHSSLDTYVRAATDAAGNVATIINGSLQRMEDAFISWARTGKLSAKDLFAFMAEEYLRQLFRMQASSLITGGVGGLLGSLGKVFGFGGSGATATLASALPGDSLDNFLTLNNNFKGHANGLDYVPYNGYPALLHEGEKVLTRQAAQAERSTTGAGVHIDFSGQVLNVGAGVSRGEFASALKANNSQQEARIRRLLATGAIGA